MRPLLYDQIIKKIILKLPLVHVAKQELGLRLITESRPHSPCAAIRL